MSKLFFLIVSLMVFQLSLAQSVSLSQETDTTVSDSVRLKQAKDYTVYPYWITMMDEPHANYFEVQRAFYTYWQNREVPVREDNEARDIFGSTQEEKPRPTEYVYEYKRFKFWERYYKDLIDEQGYILSPEQILAIWEKQQKGAEQK